ncbi:MAG: ParB/RepB/Spo0J family partition protein [Lachnospiraceae bacterium]|nr:ParB/RepB/Spo0J family partition protein [Lachnospiraceae bacterium]
MKATTKTGTKNRKTGLGKGLDLLIPDIDAEEFSVKEKKGDEKEGSAGGGPVLLKINDIEPNRNQPRKKFNEDALQELSESIKQFGVIQPLVVQKRDDYYEIIAGERRWRASKLAGIKEVPVIIKDYSEQEIVEIALIENIQREDLNPIEEAQAYRRLIDEYDLKQDELAERISKSRTAITNSMRLLKLSDDVQQMLIEDMISSGHARALLSIDDKEQQYQLALKIMDEKLSVRETEKLVKQLSSPKPEKIKPVLENAFVYEDIERKIKEIVGTKVKVNHKQNGKGKIEIEYYSDSELERLLELFMKAKSE